MDKNTFFLFDMDGVLLQPGGYRAATRATFEWLCLRMNLRVELAEESMAACEAHGITSEWDMIALFAAQVWNETLMEIQSPRFSGIEDALIWHSRRPVHSLEVNWEQVVEAAASWVKPGEMPATSWLNGLMTGRMNGFWGRLAGQPGLAGALLGHTRDVEEGLLTGVFQSLVLGSNEFERAFGLPAPIEAVSTLKRYDRPLISGEMVERVKGLRNQRGPGAALFTARPSQIEGAAPRTLTEYSPEADLAVELLGLEAIPLVGLGQSAQIAREAGVLTEQVLKPEPYQALAALVAAGGASAEEWSHWTAGAVLAARAGQARLSHPSLPEQFAVHIFEDSPVGLIAGQKAAALLRQSGHTVELVLWGIASNPVKARTLEQLGARIMPDINSALTLASG